MTVAEFVRTVKRRCEKETVDMGSRRIQWGNHVYLEDTMGNKLKDKKISPRAVLDKITLLILQVNINAKWNVASVVENIGISKESAFLKIGKNRESTKNQGKNRQRIAKKTEDGGANSVHTYQDMWDVTPEPHLLVDLPQEYTFETALADLIKGPSCVDTVVGQGNTTSWKMCGLDKNTSLTVYSLTLHQVNAPTQQCRLPISNFLFSFRHIICIQMAKLGFELPQLQGDGWMASAEVWYKEMSGWQVLGDGWMASTENLWQGCLWLVAGFDKETAPV